jgi:RNA polymerase sigma-70 factor (ECF subfamily)
MPDLFEEMGEGNAAACSREEQFTELFTECYGPVLAFARRRLGPDLAQDVVAETFLTVWRWFDQLSGQPLPWLYRVAGHAIANQRRGLARRQRLDERARLLSDDVATPDHAETVAETGRLAAAFVSLSERDREVLRLVTWEGLDVTLAAVVLGCSPATFRVRLHRARRRLSRLLGEDGRERNPEPTQPAAVTREEPSS